MIPLTVTARSWPWRAVGWRTPCADLAPPTATRGIADGDRVRSPSTGDGRVEVTIGTMIETPRAALRAAEIAEVADFFSFGTNDLTQMTFGFSRDDVEGRMMSAYLELGLLPPTLSSSIDPDGVGELVRLGVMRGRATRPGLKVGVCGEHGGDPESIATFYEAGLDYVSCSPFRVPVARLASAQAVLAAGHYAEPAERGRVQRLGCIEREGRGPPVVIGRPPAVLSGADAVAIPDEDVAQVRAATDIVALVGEHSALRRQGRRWVGLCPFHAEKTPSFSVNAEEGFYYCFGCQASGTPSASCERDRLDFVDAVRILADRAGSRSTRMRWPDRTESGARAARRHGPRRVLVPRAPAVGPRCRSRP